MAIRKFVAQTTREAMMQVRRELGEDAVILANKRVGNRIEVLAAAPDAVEALVERSELQSAVLRERVPAAERRSNEVRQQPRAKVEAFQDFVRRQMQDADSSPESQTPVRPRPPRAAHPAQPARGSAAVDMYQDVAAEIDGDDELPVSEPARPTSRAPQAKAQVPGQQRPAAPIERSDGASLEPRATRAQAAAVQASHRAQQVEMDATRADPAVFRRRPAHVAPRAAAAAENATPAVPAKKAQVAQPAPVAPAGAVAPTVAAKEPLATRAEPAGTARAHATTAASAAAPIAAGSAAVPSVPAQSHPVARPQVDIDLAVDAAHVSWMESAQVAIPGVEPAQQPAHQPRQPQPPVQETMANVAAQPTTHAAPQPTMQPVSQPTAQAAPQPVAPVLAQNAQHTAPAMPQPVAPAVPAMHSAAHSYQPLPGQAHTLAPSPAQPVAWVAASAVPGPASGGEMKPGIAPSAHAAPAQPAAAALTPVSIAIPAYPPQPRGVETQLLAELQSMRSLLQEQLATIASRPAEPAPQPQHTAATRVMTRLLTAGFSVDVARRIAGYVPAATDVTQAGAWLHEVLAHNIKCAGAGEGIVERAGQPASPGQVFALVGPTGVGKTTTVAKLAARFAVKHGTSALGLVTLDTYRVGAPEQLRTYGRILGTPVHLAQDAATLRELMATMVHKRLVLIDTCGVSQRDQRLAEMLDLLATAGAPGRPIQRVLLLNAASHAETLDDAARAWRAHESCGAILTKLDEASRIGGALDVSLRHRLSLLGLTNGQRVPEDWHAANPKLLAHLALKPAAQLFELVDEEGAALAGAAQPAPATNVAHGASHV